MSNIYLKGDINYDGYINMVDYNMIRSQLGNDPSLLWEFNANKSTKTPTCRHQRR